MAQGVPFAREYGGLLSNRSFGGAQVSRTFYARGQTGQQLLLGAYQALERQVATGQVSMFPRTEMLDLIVADGRAQTRTEDQADRREQIGARADDPGASGREIVAGAGEPRRHVALASAALSRSITATGVGSTPRRSAT